MRTIEVQGFVLVRVEGFQRRNLLVPISNNVFTAVTTALEESIWFRRLLNECEIYDPIDSFEFRLNTDTWEHEVELSGDNGSISIFIVTESNFTGVIELD